VEVTKSLSTATDRFPKLLPLRHLLKIQIRSEKLALERTHVVQSNQLAPARSILETAPRSPSGESLS
jgi:hypothetical protein